MGRISPDRRAQDRRAQDRRAPDRHAPDSHAPDRRALLAGFALAACAAPRAIDLDAAIADSEPDEIVPLWPGEAPGGANVTATEQILERPNDQGLRDRIALGVTRPVLSVFRANPANGAALLIVPGGGYRHVVIDKEGFETARWFAARGVSAFVLRYRLPYDRWRAGPDAPLDDAKRAMRVIRAGAGRWRVDPARLAAIGFSAGGHVAASLAERYAEPRAPGGDAPDAIDALDAQPALSLLLYPVITMGPSAHTGSRSYLLGEGHDGAGPERAALERYSLERHVHPGMTPTMVIHAADDDTVPLANAMLLFEALGAQGVKRELHVFEEGGHGFALRFARGKPVQVWPELAHAWMARHGLMG